MDKVKFSSNTRTADNKLVELISNEFPISPQLLKSFSSKVCEASKLALALTSFGEPPLRFSSNFQ